MVRLHVAGCKVPIPLVHANQTHSLHSLAHLVQLNQTRATAGLSLAVAGEPRARRPGLLERRNQTRPDSAPPTPPLEAAATGASEQEGGAAGVARSMLDAQRCRGARAHWQTRGGRGRVKHLAAVPRAPATACAHDNELPSMANMLLRVAVPVILQGRRVRAASASAGTRRTRSASGAAAGASTSRRAPTPPAATLPPASASVRSAYSLSPTFPPSSRSTLV